MMEIHEFVVPKSIPVIQMSSLNLVRKT
jgi:hypothetical protein